MNDNQQGFAPQNQFVGRREKTQAILAAIGDGAGGGLTLVGPPGIGKSALLAHLVATFEDISRAPVAAYFFRRDSAQSLTQDCLATLINALRRKHGRRLQPLPATVPDLSAELAQELQRISLELVPDAHELVVIDAVDEAESPRELLGALPLTLPRGVFLLLSSRPTDDLRSILPFIEPRHQFALEPHSRENLEDAAQFLQLQLPRWPQRECHRFAADLGGSFLLLRLLADVARRRDAGPPELRSLVETLSPEAGFDVVYERFWQLLRRDIEKRNPADLERVFDLAGALSVCFEPVTRSLLTAVLNWSGSRLERLIQYLEPYLSIEIDAVSGEPAELFAIYHDTFRAFVRRRLSPDVAANHRRVSQSLTQQAGGAGLAGRNQSYRLRYHVLHASLSDDPQSVLRIVDVEFVRTRSQRAFLNHQLAKDLLLAVGVAVGANDLPALVFLTVGRALALARGKEELSAAEELLEVRKGDFSRALETSFLLNPGDGLLVIAEALAAESCPQGTRRQLAQRLQEVASGAGEGPALLAAMRIAGAEPALAIDLLDHCRGEKSDPHLQQTERCKALALLAGDVARRHGESAAEALMSCLREPLEIAVATAACGASMLLENPERGYAWLRRVVESWPGEGRSAIEHAVGNHLQQQLSRLGPRAGGAVFDMLAARIDEVGVNDPILAGYVDELLEAYPEVVETAAERDPDCSAVEYVRWRARMAGLADAPVEEVRSLGVRRRQLAADISSNSESVGGLIRRADAVQLLRDPQAQLALAAAVLSKTQQCDSFAAALSVVGVHLAVQHSPPFGVDAASAFLSNLLSTPGEQRRQAIELAVETGKGTFDEVTARSRRALQRALTHRWERQGASLDLLLDLIREQPAESVRRDLLLAVVAHASTSTLRRMVDEPGAVVDLILRRPAPEGSPELFGPATQVRLLSALARRLDPEQPQIAEPLLRVAADICARIGDAKEREEEIAPYLLTAALLHSPVLAWELVERARVPWFWMDCLAVELLSHDLAEHESLAAAVLRLSICLTHFRDLDLPASEAGILIELIAELNGSAYSLAVGDAAPGTDSLVQELGELLQGYVDLFGDFEEEVGSGEMEAIAALVARRDWEAFQRAARTVSLRPAFRDYHLSRLGPALLFSPRTQAEQQLADVRHLSALRHREADDLDDFAARCCALILAAKAATEPRAFAEAVVALPDGCEAAFQRFPAALEHFENPVAWTTDDLRAAVDALFPRIGLHAGLHTMAVLGVWLRNGIEDAEDFLRATLKVALEKSAGHHLLFSLARLFDGQFPDQARVARIEAVRRLLASESPAAIVASVERETLDEEARATIADSLDALLDAEALSTDQLIAVAEVATRVRPELALRALSAIVEPGCDRDLERRLQKAVRSSVDHIPISTAGEVATWRARIASWSKLSEPLRRELLLNLETRSIGLGIVPDLESAKARPYDHAALLLALCRRQLARGERPALAEPREVIASLAHGSEGDRIREELFDLLFAAGDAMAAEEVARELLDSTRLESSFAMIELRLGRWLGLAAKLPAERFAALLKTAWAVFKGFSVAGLIDAETAVRESGLSQIAVAAWPVDRGMTRKWLRELLRGEVASSPAREVLRQIGWRVVALAEHEPEEAIQLARFARSLVPPHEAEGSAELLLETLLHEESTAPVAHLGVFTGLLRDEGRAQVVRYLLPALSNRGRSRANLALALFEWKERPDLAGRNLQAAMRYYDSVGVSLVGADHEKLACYALAFGFDGAVRATAALAEKPGRYFAECLAHLVGIAILDRGRDPELVSALWGACVQAVELFADGGTDDRRAVAGS